MQLLSTGINKGFISQEPAGSDNYVRDRDVKECSVMFEENIVKAFTSVDLVPAHSAPLPTAANIEIDWEVQDFSGWAGFYLGSASAADYGAAPQKFFNCITDQHPVHGDLGTMLATPGHKVIPLNVYGIAQLRACISSQHSLYPIAMFANDGGHGGTVSGKIVGDVKIVW